MGNLRHADEARLRLFCKDHCQDRRMASRRRGGPGRSSKGDRHAFLTRIPREAADQVIAEAEARGMPYGEYIAILVSRAHGYEVALPDPITPVPQQEVLGISA
jgi:hypothetical protein